MTSQYLMRALAAARECPSYVVGYFSPAKAGRFTLHVDFRIRKGFAAAWKSYQIDTPANIRFSQLRFVAQEGSPIIVVYGKHPGNEEFKRLGTFDMRHPTGVTASIVRMMEVERDRINAMSDYEEPMHDNTKPVPGDYEI